MLETTKQPAIQKLKSTSHPISKPLLNVHDRYEGLSPAPWEGGGLVTCPLEHAAPVTAW